ncbi:MAG: PepSY-associated TM helix domain-containing protein [Bryobacteraceae bacterium]|nr:PepSY-associated TM helix domain-containing protein [Bryobacteraceae bacterium]
MLSFGVLLFFAVTGITLNHTDWFTSAQRTVQVKGKLNPAWVKSTVAKLEVVEHLRRAHRVSGALSDFRIEDAQCSVSFKGPAYTADVFLDRATGAYDLTETRMGFIALLNDLHKGRDSGRAWAWVIDLSALLMTLVSLSGLVLIFYLQKRLLSGLVTLGGGALACYLAYWYWVP